MTRFRAVGPALVRVPSRPYAGQSSPAPSPESREELVGYVRQMLEDAEFVAAVALASPSALRWSADEVPALPLKRLRGLALTLRAYETRMRCRATPFGLFAGVVLEGHGTGVDRLVTRPSSTWLDPLVRAVQQLPDVLLRLRLVTNPDARLEGAHVVVDRPSSGVRSARVRIVPGIRAVLAAAGDGVPGAELVDLLGTEGVPASTALTLLRELTAHGILRSTLWWDPHTEDRLRRLTTGLEEADVLPELRDALVRVSGALDAYAAAEVAAQPAALDRLRHHVDRALATVNLPTHEQSPAQVDLVLGRHVDLGATVRREVEDTAAVMARLWRADEARAVQQVLLARGGGQALPLADVELEAARRERRPVSAAPALVRAVDDCTVGHVDELVLDDELLDAIAVDDAWPVADFDVPVVVAARDEGALGAGDFTLHLRRPCAVGAGVTLARLAATFGPGGRAAAASVANARDAARPDALHADLTFYPGEPQAADISGGALTRCVRVLCNDVPTDHGGAMIPAHDLLVAPSPTGPRVWSRSSGAEVVPRSSSAVAAHAAGPRVAQLLEQVSGDNAALEFPWGELLERPWLPRVRRGRTILSPRRWRLSSAQLTAPRAEPRDDGLARWRKTWRVPDRVVLAQGDRQLPLDLEDPTDVALLRRSLGAGPVVLLEAVDTSAAWWQGSRGAHLVEAVFPVVRNTPTLTEPVEVPVEVPEVAPTGRTSSWGSGRLRVVARCSRPQARALALAVSDVLGGVQGWYGGTPDGVVIDPGAADLGSVAVARVLEVVDRCGASHTELVPRPPDAGVGVLVNDLPLLEAWSAADSAAVARSRPGDPWLAVRSTLELSWALAELGQAPFDGVEPDRSGLAQRFRERVPELMSDPSWRPDHSPACEAAVTWAAAAPTARSVAGRTHLLLRAHAGRWLTSLRDEEVVALAAAADHRVRSWLRAIQGHVTA